MDPSRRQFLQAVGGLGLGLGAAGPAAEKLIPYLVPPENIEPGNATWFATTCRACPAGCGLIVKNREGRAVKCEGHPDHPINEGKLCARGQATLQGLYDPDRVTHPLQRGSDGTLRPVVWDAVAADLAPRLRARPVAVITDRQLGTLGDVIADWLTALGGGPADHLMFEPLPYAARQQVAARFGAGSSTDLSGADRVLSLGADFLDTWHNPVRQMLDWSRQREPFGGLMQRVSYAGSRMSVTAANADERIWLAPGQEGALGMAVLSALLELRDGTALHRRLAAGHEPETVGPLLGVEPETIRGLARSLASSRRPVVLGDPPAGDGPEQLATVTASLLINDLLQPGSATANVPVGGATGDELRAFAAGLPADGILLVFGANPVYALPEDHPLRVWCERPESTLVSLAVALDETAAAADWVLPVSHALETWDDVVLRDGITGLVQPVMGALYQTVSAGEMLFRLAAMAGLDRRAVFGAESYDERLRQGLGESEWREAAQRGFLRRAEPEPAGSLDAAADFSIPPPEPAAELTLEIYPSRTLGAGEGANKPWLQELPDPITHVVWQSWCEISKSEAEQRGLKHGDIVKITAGERSVELPVVVLPQMADGTVAVPLGQGHTAYGRFAKGRGVNLLPWLWDSGPVIRGVTLAPTGEHHPAINTDGGTEQNDREIAQFIPLASLETAAKPEIDWPLPESYRKEHDLYPPHEHTEHRWGMVIDLDKCTGCSNCVTACYAENNLPVVGPELVEAGREMSWLRIDRYFEPDNEQLPVLFQPMLCQHCDAAPCEPVCPVFAAYHTDEGLNGQVYNRCVGTRYCSNNCPYKVRRFNWFEPQWPEPLNWQLNPDVTVRSRGVMEKCTFCVQRIRGAERTATLEGRAVRDGEIVTACAQACPAEAIVFGDLRDPSTRVHRLAEESNRRYQVLGELNTKPAVIYLKRVVRGV